MEYNYCRCDAKRREKSVLPVVLAAIIVDPMVDIGIGLSDFRYSKREDK